MREISASVAVQLKHCTGRSVQLLQCNCSSASVAFLISSCEFGCFRRPLQIFISFNRSNTGPAKITSHPVSESFPMLNDPVSINRLNCDLIDLEPVTFEKIF